MKQIKKGCMVVACLLLMAGYAFASEKILPTDEYAADALVATGRYQIYGIVVMTDGTNNVEMDVYDNTAGSGTKMIPTWTIPTSATVRSASYSFGTFGAPIETGVYVDITVGGGGSVGYMLNLREK